MAKCNISLISATLLVFSLTGLVHADDGMTYGDALKDANTYCKELFNPKTETEQFNGCLVNVMKEHGFGGEDEGK